MFRVGAKIKVGRETGNIFFFLPNEWITRNNLHWKNVHNRRVGRTLRAAGILRGQITVRTFCHNNPNFDRIFLNFFGHHHSFVDVLVGEVGGVMFSLWSSFLDSLYCRSDWSTVRVQNNILGQNVLPGHQCLGHLDYFSDYCPKANAKLNPYAVITLP